MKHQPLLIINLIAIGLFSCDGQTCQHKCTGIDTHIHLYEPNGLDWLKESNRRLYRPHLAKEFSALNQHLPINQAILIEAGISYEHTQWMLSHASTNKAIAAVIGNLDLSDPNTAHELRGLAKHKKFRGIRNRARGNIDYSSTVVKQNLKVMQKLNLVLETGVTESSKKELSIVADEFPGLRIILNHMAGGVLSPKNQPQDWWPDTVRQLSKHPNIYCKLSMFDVAFRNDYTTDRLNSLFIPLIQAFGTERLLYGSNWPVTDNPSEQFKIFTQATRQLTPDAIHAILIRNPIRAYRLNMTEIEE